MDLGVLGIVAARAGEGDDFPAFAAAWWAGQRDSSGAWLQWEASEFEVRSAGPIPAGVDGEALVFDPPLRLRSLPGPFASVCPPPEGPWAAPRAGSDGSRSFTGDEMATGRRSGCLETFNGTTRWIGSAQERLERHRAAALGRSRRAATIRAPRPARPARRRAPRRGLPPTPRARGRTPTAGPTSVCPTARTPATRPRRAAGA
jgi:hypothetical protein